MVMMMTMVMIIMMMIRRRMNMRRMRQRKSNRVLSLTRCFTAIILNQFLPSLLHVHYKTYWITKTNPYLFFQIAVTDFTHNSIISDSFNN